MSVKEDASAKVRRIHVIGAEHTRNDLLKVITCPLFNADTVSQLLNSLNGVRQHLATIGVFSHIRAIVDVAKKEKDDESDYEVTFLVRERRRATGSIRTELETNGMALRMGGRLMNATGRADQASVEFIRGSYAESGYAFGYTLPVNGDVNRLLQLGCGRTSFENYLPFLVPSSAYRQRESYVFVGHEMPLQHHYPLKYGVRMEHIWRRIEAQSQITPLALRTLEGDSVKTALRHFISVDTRDSTTLPTSGYFARINQEISVPPGDSRYIKHEIECQYARSLRNLPFTLHASLHAGHMVAIPNSAIALPDRYFIGGPLTLRGFILRGIGHSSTTSANAADSSNVGGNCFWIAALHGYAPLPFLGRPTLSASNVGDDDDDPSDLTSPNPIQLHGFLTAGDLAPSGLRLLQSLSRFPIKNESLIRVSAGAGIVIRLGSIARLELNYTVPLRSQPSDSLRPGFQFGIGVQFV